MMIKSKAFTLTELLLALTIVGTIATLTVPRMMEDIHKKTSIAQLKNTINQIELAITKQMTEVKTSDLTNTVFNNVNNVASAFDTSIVCNNNNREKCWNTAPYKIVNRNTQAAWTPGSIYFVLKNGTSISYSRNEGNESFPNLVGTFYIDLNGNNGPNIIGRDAFAMYVTREGKLQGYWGTTNNASLAQVKANIAGDENMSGVATNCYNYLTMNNWVMDY